MNRIRFVLTAFPRVISAPHWIQLKENLETSLKHFCDKKTVLYSGRTDSIVPEMSADAVVSGVAAGKKAAAYRAVDEWVKDGQNLGIGSGSTIVFAVERLAQRVKTEKLTVTCVPTSFQARQLIIDNGLILSDLESNPELDVAIDGADEVDPNLSLIKGGGGCQTQEKIVAASAKTFIVIADDSKQSSYLGEKWQKGLPIEVLPFAYKVVKLKIERGFGGTADLRMAKQKAGPVVTDNGNLILDWKFKPSPGIDWSNICQKLSQISGIVETGLFYNMAYKVYFGTSEGSVKTLVSSK